MDKAYLILLEGYLIEKDLLHDFQEEMYKVTQAPENHPNVLKAAEFLTEEMGKTLELW